MYFAGELIEHNGEQEYSYDYIIEADNLKEAENILDGHAKTFYDDKDVESDNEGYCFFGGALFVAIGTVHPTTKEEWLEEMFRQNLLQKEGG